MPGHREIALKLLLMAEDLLVEAGIFDGDGDLCGEGGEGAFMALVEVVGLDVFQIEDADDAVFVEERDDHFRTRFSIDHEVAGVFGDVGDVDQSPLSDGCADQAGVDGEPARGHAGVAEAPGVASDEAVAGRVDQHDGKHLIVDEAAEELADALKELVKIEDGG